MDGKPPFVRESQMDQRFQNSQNQAAQGSGAAAGTSSEAGNRKVAILFTDLKGSSAFYKTHGNLAGRVMIQKLNDMLFPIVRAYKGVIVKTIGDSIMAYFLNAKDALWAAVAMQKRLHTYNRENGKPQDQLLIRVAMNYGDGIVEEKDVFGDVVNVAGKLINVCDAQQVLVTEHFYRETSGLSEVAFAEYSLSDQKGQLRNVRVYEVQWEKIQDADESPNRYLLTLKIESASPEGPLVEGSRRVLPLIKRAAEKIAASDDSEIQAVFRKAEECLEASTKAMQHYLGRGSAGSDLPHVIRVGLDASPKKNPAEQDYREIFKNSAAACESAGPYEVVLTSRFHGDLAGDLRRSCKPIKGAAGTLYRFSAEAQDNKEAVFTRLLPESEAPSGAMTCFYCGSSRHRTAACPSKLIRKPTRHLERLAYTPMHVIRDTFQKNFSNIIEPLQSASKEKRFDLLFRENVKDPYTLCFFSFYEITEMFQLRSLNRIFEKSRSGKEAAGSRSGKIMMGEDCLRVSRFSEAEEWFSKAVEEQPKDYRPHVLMGILAAERDSLGQAVLHFKKAMAFSLNNPQERLLRVLVARVMELKGELFEAQREVEKAIKLAGGGGDYEYYLGVLLARQGKAAPATEIFRKLIYQSPRYYLMISLNPALEPAKKEMMSFLNRELVNIRNRSQKSFEAIRKIISGHGRSFSKDDEDFKSAGQLAERAGRVLQEESVAGLMDIPGIEINVDQLISRAMHQRQLDLRRKLAAHRKTAAAYAGFLNRFPYRSMISGKDYQMADDFERRIDGARRTADKIPPPSPQEGRAMLRDILKEARRLQANRERLELIGRALVVGEYSLRLLGIFFSTAAGTAVVFSAVLAMYQGYEDSFSSLSADRVLGYVKFGLYAGLFTGFITATVWLKNNFYKLFTGTGS